MATKRQEGDPQSEPEVDEDDEDAIEESIEVAGVPLVVWVVRLTLILFIQGLIVLGSYAYYGFGTDAAHFGPGFRLDPIHAHAAAQRRALPSRALARPARARRRVGRGDQPRARGRA